MNAGPCNWRIPNDADITTEAEVQQLAQLHFTVCPTNPDAMQWKQERVGQAEHDRRMDLAAEEKGANPQWSGDNPRDQSTSRATGHIHQKNLAEEARADDTQKHKNNPKDQSTSSGGAPTLA